MKTFFSVEDIEGFADQGLTEIFVDQNTVITDLAKQTASMLGIKVVEKQSTESPVGFTNSPQPVIGKPMMPEKPKGCQRRPVQNSLPVSGVPAEHSRQVVDKLVEKIRSSR